MKRRDEQIPLLRGDDHFRVVLFNTRQHLYTRAYRLDERRADENGVERLIAVNTFAPGGAGTLPSRPTRRAAQGS